MENKKVVLITGCSTGIGRELCRVLTNKGYAVAATARDPETLKDLPVSLKLPLDVTKTETINSAISEIISRFHKIDILINNAGYSIRGALEEVSVESMKNMFDVNVFGIVNMIHAVLPEMRKNKSGRIINIGSISGRFTQPVNGAYCASKHAVEAINDALRLELYRENIEVTVIEPGPIQTNFFKAMAERSSIMANPDSCYAAFYDFDSKFKEKQKLTPAQEAAEDISEIIGKKHLKARYEVAVPYVFSMMARFPDSLKEYMLMKSR